MMIFFVILCMVFFLFLFGYYFYFFLRVLKELFAKKKNLKKFYLLSFFGAIVITILCLRIFDVWLVLFAHFLVFSCIFDLLFFLFRKKNIGNKVIHKLYTLGVYPLVLCCIFVIYGYLNMTTIVRTDYEITTEKILSTDYHIVAISDLHYGTTMEKEKLKKEMEKIQEEKPDIFLLLGDIVDEHTTKEQMHDVFSILSNIKTKYGIYYIYGNHDQTLYYQNPHFSLEELKEVIEQNQIHILRDSNIIIKNELVLLGRDDLAFPKEKERKTTEELIQGIDTNQFLLLLDHQPVELEKNKELGIDLQLSGHTHAGQVFPTGILSELFKLNEMNYGYRKSGKYQIIVSSGIGGWAYPLRTGAHSEYIVIDIQSNKV